MTVYQIIGTLTGGFIYPFMLRICWGNLVKDFGAFGGWMASIFVVSSTWMLNHRVGLIYQSGSAWIDMAWPAAVGLYIACRYDGDCGKKCMPTIISAIIASFMAAAIIYVIFQYRTPWPI